MILFLTSSAIGTYRSEEPLTYSGFNPANGLADELRSFWKEDSRCLMISAFPEETELNERLREEDEEILRDTGLSFSSMDLCDARNGRECASRLHSYDFVILGGGHVPTQNAFFRETGILDAFRGFEGIVMGISAGSMNCAEMVYAQPEMPVEAADPSYRRFIPGLGLTKYNILPHYNAVKDDLVDGLRLFEEITIPDSMGHTFYAIVDGSFLLETGDRAEIRGEAYRIRDGKFEQISGYGEVYRLA